ncbi:heavy-metal-associated domain-containing protein [Neobacillus cucumis]|uniref:heavy-metal-associated domain-containing protein n=1 Tax=Neobacillus cucumis TaxID=1740721 RepID=UPI0028533C32|nr:heavy-metal-associated domain-containing protein [Neobacillus cucumis]MDR4947972.1 heavy-metal-associated domain-containing protein [Neobacillus cucumis]
METRVLSIKNMANQQDADKVLKAIEHVWGYTQAEIDLSKGQAKYSYDEKMASSQDFEQAILDLGYEIRTQEELE